MPENNGWILTIAFGVAMSLHLGCDPSEVPRAIPDKPENSSSLRSRIMNYLDVVQSGPDESGKSTLVPVTALTNRRKALFCDEQTDEILFPGRLWTAITCLGKTDPSWLGDLFPDDPGLPEGVRDSPHRDSYRRDPFRNDRLREVLSATLEKLDNRVASDPKLAADPRALQKTARELYNQGLDEMGVLDELEQAWNEHVVARSACFESIRSETEPMIEAQREEAVSRGYCDGWEAGLDVCTNDSKKVVDHITYHPQELSEKQLGALKNLLDAKLSYCLAAIIETDPELAETVSALGRIPGSGGSTPELRARVWKLWRTHGIVDLLDRTVDGGGTVTKEDEDLIVDCILRKFPTSPDES